MERMWNPNETLGAWARDDDVLSWRSLDTLRGVETDQYDVEPVTHVLSDSGSDTSDTDDLAEVFHRGLSTIGVNKPVPGASVQRPLLDRRICPPQEATTLPAEESGFQRVMAPTSQGTRVLETEVDEKIRRLEGELTQRELPSTSEMVSIREPSPTTQHPELVGRRIQRALATPPRESQPPPRTFSYADHLGHDEFAQDGLQGLGYAEEPAESMSNQLQRSPAPVEASRRGSMTLGDLLAKRKTDAAAAELPSSVAGQQILMPMMPDSGPSMLEMRALERRCQELQDKERHLQTVLAKQLVQIESLSEQLQQKDGLLQVQVLELSGFKEQVARLEKQNAHLTTSIREKEQAQEHCMQQLLQKTNELSAMETKMRSVQITNETFQEQAQKATQDKDKVHKDYLQVVYDLSKLQKQMNAAAKETVNVAEKDLLLREIDQLRHEKDQLASKLKDAEARKMTLQQSSSVNEIQRQREFQSRIRELEDDLLRARNLRPPQASSQAPTSATIGSDRSSQMYQPPTAQSMDFQRLGQQGMPSLLQGMNPGYNAPVASHERPMTLKDMMSDRRPPPAPSTVMLPNSNGNVTSLASLGFSGHDRRSSSGNAFDFEQFKADALARRSTSINDLIKQSSGYAPYDAPPPSANPALSAPFATEKQTLLQDSLQKRDLEQKLLKYHVEKEQTEAKLVKVEQSGLKTMSARTEKAWLESRLRDLTLEISRLKLSLR